MSFVHLHNHTDHSFLDGATKVTQLAETALEMEMPAVAITDHGNLCGAIEFYRRAKKVGIKPIIGAELYITDGSRLEKGKDLYGHSRARYHLLLLAKNERGYKNLMKLSSAGYLEGFYHKPRIDYELLQKHSEGLICLSGCIQGHINQSYLINGEEKARELIERYQTMFGEDFYFEVQNHGIEDETQITSFLSQMSREYNIKLVATNDTHYLKKEHSIPHDILLCIQTASDLHEPNRLKFDGNHYYLKSREEMAQLFPDHPDALDNTLEIAEKVNLDFDFTQKHFPFFPLPSEVGSISHDEYLRQLCEEGLPQRYSEITDEIRERLDTEMEIITKKNLADYFLIVRDFIAHAKSKNIPVGPGRGSAAGSLVSYLIGITNIDPIKYGLLFERFINPERESYPDIDVDFSDMRRGEVIEYVRKKYGNDNVCQIITYGRMLSKGVIRDVGRVMQIPLPEVNAITKLIPDGPRVTLNSALSDSEELNNLLNSRGEYQELLEKSLVLEGTIRNAGVHACGVLITPDALTEHVPLYKAPDGEVTTQFDMNNVEQIGLLKVDFLGLKTLTIIERTLELLHRDGIELTLDEIPVDDAATYELFSRGDTIGIFQFESGGMRDSIRKLKPERLEDLTAMNALYRPGPMENIGEFVARKHGKQKIKYLHPKLAEILDETYGIIVYQEQVMKIANILSGMSLGRADVLRRAMGKKKQQLMDELQPEFIGGCEKNGIKKKIAQDIWDLINKFAKYGFNKSHAAGYALIAYQTGYLKTHYPAQFMAASMTTRHDNTDELVLYLEECRKMGLEVLPPDVNQSEEDFTVTEDGKVLFGLGAIKNVGGAAIQAILGQRIAQGKFSDLFDLARTVVETPLVNRKVLESLIHAGATESLEGHRAQQLAVLDQSLTYAQQIKQERACGQVNIFGEADGTNSLPRPELPDIPKMPSRQRLAAEKQLLGLYFSGHPLLQYKREVEFLSSASINDIETDSYQKQSVRIAGILNTVSARKTRRGQMMARGKLEDLTGMIPIIIFPNDYSNLQNRIVEDKPVLVTGEVQQDGDNSELFVQDIQPLKEAAIRMIKGIEVHVKETVAGKALLDLEQLVRNNTGQSLVQIVFESEEGDHYVTTSDRYKISPEREVLNDIEKVTGEDTIRLIPIG